MAVKKRLLSFALFGMLLTFIPTSVFSVGIEPVKQPQAVQLEVKDGLLTVSVKDVPLPAILKKLADQTGLGFEMYGNTDRKITVRFNDIPFNQGVKRILRGCSSTITYSDVPSPTSSPSKGTIQKITVYDEYGRKSGTPLQSQASRIPYQRKRGSGQEQNLSGKSERTKRYRSNFPRKWPQEKVTQISIESYAEQLQSADWEKREEAIIAIASEYPEEALNYLTQALLHDDNSDIRTLAAEEIGFMDDKKGIEALAKAIHDPDEEAREAVVDALGEIGGTEALQPLQQALQDSNEDVQEAASYLIEEIKEESLEIVDQVPWKGTQPKNKTAGYPGRLKKTGGKQ